MKTRNAFTLIELLVVIGIILMLAAILLPLLSRARRQALINTQKLDFQAITSAIEAYRADFGGIPTNSSLPAWNSANPRPQFLSLATALIGPGSMYTQVSNGINQAGDGANGFGFRCAYAIVPSTLLKPASAGSTTITVQVYGSILPPYPPTSAVPNSLFVSINDPAAGSDGALGVVSYLSSSAGPGKGYALTLTLATPLQASHPAGVSVPFKTPTGNLWGPYLSPDRFKYIWNAPKFPGQPQLLDRWGGPIQYFTRFGPNSNRTVLNGVANPNFPIPSPPPKQILAGPLYGISASPAINASGASAIWDQNDGSLNTNTAEGIDESLAFKWMLGDDDGDNLIDNLETFHYTGDFVLISAGPDTDDSSVDPNIANTATYNVLPISRFCNLSGIASDQWDQTFRASANIYNFDR